MSNIENAHEECRTLGHAWTVVRTAGWTALAIKCMRCTAERIDRIDPFDGKLEKRQYVYPEGYQYAPGQNVPSRSDFRLRLMKRLDPTGEAPGVRVTPE